MKEIFKNKKWIAFFLALILVVTVGVNSSDTFLWATGDAEETAPEESGTQAHSSDEEGGEGAPEAETGGENTEFAEEAGVTSGNQFITAEREGSGTSDGQEASDDGQTSDGQQPGGDSSETGQPTEQAPDNGQQPGDPSTGQPSDGQQTGDPSTQPQPGNNGGTVDGTVVITPDTVDGTTVPGEADGASTSGAGDGINTPGVPDGTNTPGTTEEGTVTEGGLPVASDKVADGALYGTPGMEEVDPDELLMTVEEEELLEEQEEVTTVTVTVQLENSAGEETETRTAVIKLGLIRDNLSEISVDGKYEFAHARYNNANIDTIYYIKGEDGAEGKYYVSGSSNQVTDIAVDNTTDIILTYKEKVAEYAVAYEVYVDNAKVDDNIANIVEILGADKATAGMDYQFTVTPKLGYTLDGVTVNGKAVTQGGDEKCIIDKSNVINDFVVIVRLKETKLFNLVVTGVNTRFWHETNHNQNAKEWGSWNDGNKPQESGDYFKFSSEKPIVIYLGAKNEYGNNGKELNLLEIVSEAGDDIYIEPPISGEGQKSYGTLRDGTSILVENNGKKTFNGATGNEYKVTITGADGKGPHGWIKINSNYRDITTSEIWPKDLVGIKNLITVREGNEEWIEGDPKKLELNYSTQWKFAKRYSDRSYRVYIGVEKGYLAEKDKIEISMLIDGEWYYANSHEPYPDSMFVLHESNNIEGYNWYLEIPANQNLNGREPGDIRISAKAQKLEDTFKVQYKSISDIVEDNNIYKAGDRFLVAGAPKEAPVVNEQKQVFQGWKIGDEIYQPGAIYTIKTDTTGLNKDEDGNYLYVFEAQWEPLESGIQLPYQVDIYIAGEDGSYSHDNPTISLTERGPQNGYANINFNRLQSKIKEHIELLQDESLKIYLQENWDKYVIDNQQKNVLSALITENSAIVLKVYYNRPTYEITFNIGSHGQFASGDNVRENRVYSVRSGDSFPEEIRTEFPEIKPDTGWEFTGWSGPERPVTVTRSITYTATYKGLPAKLVYEANGGTGSMNPLEDKKVGDSVTLAANQFKKNGYEFIGWNTQADGSGTAYAAGGSYTLEAVAEDENGVFVNKIYARWEKDETRKKELQYTVKYFKGTTEEQTEVHKKEVWAGDPDTLYIEADVITKDVVEKYKSDKYTLDIVVVRDKEGTIITTQPSLKENDSIAAGTVIELHYEKDELKDESVDPTNPNPTDSGDGIPDKYQKVFTYTAEAGGHGTVTGKTIEVVTVQEVVKDPDTGAITSVGSVTKKNPTQPSTVTPSVGYDFDYWTDESNTKYDTDDVLKNAAFSENKTFTAHFEAQAAKLTYMRNYDATDTEIVETVEGADVKVGSEVTVTNKEPERKGFVFTGWSTEPDGTGKPVYQKDDKYILVGVSGDNENTNYLYAQWRAQLSYSVNYYKDGQEVKDDSYTKYVNVDSASSGQIAILEAIDSDKDKYDKFTLDYININGTVAGAVPAVGKEVASGTVIDLYYAKDEWKEDPTKPGTGDDIPDKYQTVFVYKVADSDTEKGKLTGGANELENQEVVTLYQKTDDGKIKYPAEKNPSAKPAQLDKVDVKDAKYEFAYWTLDSATIEYTAEQLTGMEYEGNKTYVFTAHFGTKTVKYRVQHIGRGEGPDGTDVVLRTDEGDTYTAEAGTTVEGIKYKPTDNKLTIDSNNYIFVEAENRELSLEEAENIVKLYYYLDDMKLDQNDPSKREDGGDGIPDRWQIAIHFKADEGGTLTDMDGATEKAVDPKTGYYTEYYTVKKLVPDGTTGNYKEEAVSAPLQASVDAKNKEGYYFINWSDGAEAYKDIADIRAAKTELEESDKNKIYTAVFAKDGQIKIQYLVNPAEAGSVTRTEESLYAQTGTVAGSTAAANEGYHFVGWTKSETVNEAGDNIVGSELTYRPEKDGVSNQYESAVYYANFVGDDKTYTVQHLDADNNNQLIKTTPGKQAAVKYGDKIRGYEEKTEIENYTFVGADDLTVGIENDANIVRVYYSKDNLKDPTVPVDPDDPNPDKPGDGIPDKYQVTFKYQTDSNGMITGITEEIVTVQKIIRDADTGAVTPDGDPSPQKPSLTTISWAEGYALDYWQDETGTKYVLEDGKLKSETGGKLEEAAFATDKVFMAYSRTAAQTYTVQHLDMDNNNALLLTTDGKKAVKSGDIIRGYEEKTAINGYTFVRADELTIGKDNAENVVNVYYSKDEEKDPTVPTDPVDPDPNPDKPGDGIPDKYQITFTYQADSNGTVTGIRKETVTVQEITRDPDTGAITMVGSRAAKHPSLTTVSWNEGYEFSQWQDESDVTYGSDDILRAAEFDTDKTFTANSKARSYTLTIHYVNTAGEALASDYTAVYQYKQTYGPIYSPEIQNYRPNLAFVRSDAYGMIARNVEVTVIYSAVSNSGNTTSTPSPSSAPEQTSTPAPVPTPEATATPVTAVPGTQATPVTAEGTQTSVTVLRAPEELEAVAEDEEPVGGAIGLDENGDPVLTVVTDEEVPLAGGIFDDRCCILHFLLMLAAFILYTWYTNDMKKRQGRLAQLTDELAQEKLKRQSGV